MRIRTQRQLTASVELFYASQSTTYPPLFTFYTSSLEKHQSNRGDRGTKSRQTPSLPTKQAFPYIVALKVLV